MCIRDRPSRFDPAAIRGEKTKVLRSLRPITAADTVTGQYRKGAIDGNAVPGYDDELGRPSGTETFVALKEMCIRDSIAPMRKILVVQALALALALPAAALSAAPQASQAPDKAEPPKQRTSGEIVKAAPASDWASIAPEDLLVMTLAPDAAGKPRNCLLYTSRCV